MPKKEAIEKLLTEANKKTINLTSVFEDKQIVGLYNEIYKTTKRQVLFHKSDAKYKVNKSWLTTFMLDGLEEKTNPKNLKEIINERIQFLYEHLKPIKAIIEENEYNRFSLDVTIGHIFHPYLVKSLQEKKMQYSYLDQLVEMPPSPSTILNYSLLLNGLDCQLPIKC